MNVPELLTFTADNQVSEFFQAAEQGDLAKVKSFVASNKGKVGIQQVLIFVLWKFTHCTHGNNNNNNVCISRVPFHVKHAKLR